MLELDLKFNNKDLFIILEFQLNNKNIGNEIINCNINKFIFDGKELNSIDKGIIEINEEYINLCLINNKKKILNKIDISMHRDYIISELEEFHNDIENIFLNAYNKALEKNIKIKVAYENIFGFVIYGLNPFNKHYCKVEYYLNENYDKIIKLFPGIKKGKVFRFNDFLKKIKYIN